MNNDFDTLVSMLSPIPGTTEGWLYNFLILVVGGVFSIIFSRKYRKTQSRQLLNALPGLWTSLGLLGTFIAICISLGDIGSAEDINKEGMTLGEIAALGAASEIDIKQIISQLIPAFSTSIWGLLAAFVCTSWSKLVYAKEDAAIDSAINNKTPEEYIYDIAITVREQAIKSKEYNDRLNESLNNQSAILKKFVDDFVLRMNDIFEGMGDAIKKNINDFGEKQFENSAKVLEGVVKRMSELSETLLSQQTSSVNAMVANTNEKISTMTESIEGQMYTLNLSTIKTMTGIMADQKAKMDAIINQSVGSMEKIAAVQEEKLSSIVDQHNVFTSKVMTEATQINEKIIGEMRESLAEFVNSLQASIREQCNSLESAIASNTNLLKNNYDYIRNHIAEIRTNYEQSTRAYTDAVQNAHNMNESFEHTIKSMNTSLNALDATNKNIVTILDIVKERYEKTERLVTTISEMSAAIEVLQKLESQLNKINNKDA